MVGASESKATTDLRSKIVGQLWNNRSRWGKFGVLVLLIVALSALASIVTRLTVLRPERAPFYHVAILAPVSGEQAANGQSLADGAQVVVDRVNKSGGINGAHLAIDIYDSAEDAEKQAIAIAADKNVIAVISGLEGTDQQAARQVLEVAGIPVLTALAAEKRDADARFQFSLGYERARETQFLANYIRNVIGEVLTSVIHDDSRSGDLALFRETYERFGVPLTHVWNVTGDGSDLDTSLASIVQSVKAANDAGTLYLAMDGPKAARLVKMLRSAGVVTRIVGPRDLGTHVFLNAFSPAERGAMMTGVMTSAPLLFDTAGSWVQFIRSGYVTMKGFEPDWVAVQGARSAEVLVESASALGLGEGGPAVTERRDMVRAVLSGEKKSAASEALFTPEGVLPYPILVGQYDGADLISAATQLQPIGPREVDNYIKLVKEGRALYVNDHFMYKTNVVYSGLLVKEIQSFDVKAGTFEMDFTLWFRYRGDVAPQDIVFDNAVEPIKLGEPTRSEKAGDVNYLSYDIKAKFSANFANIKRTYGTDLLGTSFRHRELDQNNLRYVVDVIGIGLTEGETITTKLRDAKVLAPAVGRELERAWISQDIVTSESLGSLTFVGNGKPQPNFSQITFGALVADDAPSLQDFVPNEYLIYILFFAVTGSIFAWMMDRKRDGTHLFWNAQSWILRAICWPLMLVSAGTLVLDASFGSLDFAYLDILVATYKSLLWIVPTRILALSVHRFVWNPLETRTGRKVPGAIRAIVTLTIYLLSLLGILSQVFGMNVTSILAASGVLSLVVGLALQSNIANIFSGIVLNLERPFQVGDILRLTNGIEAEVIDITWRSIRVREQTGTVHSIPNALATSQQMTRVTRATGEAYVMRAAVNISPRHNPDLVVALLLAAVKSVPTVCEAPAAWVRYGGANQTEFATYNLSFASADYGAAGAVREDVWKAIWNAMSSNGIEISTLDRFNMSAAVARIAPGGVNAVA